MTSFGDDGMPTMETIEPCERKRLEGAMDRLRRAWLKPSKQVWHKIDAEWRERGIARSIPEGFERFPSSLLHLQPPPAPPTPARPTPLSTAATARASVWPAAKVSAKYLGKVCEVVEATVGWEEALAMLKERQLFAPSQQRPVVLRGLARHLLCPAAGAAWSFEQLGARAGDVLVEGVRRGAGPEQQTFHYADESKDTCFSDASAHHQLCSPMSLAEFLRRSGDGSLYLWAVLRTVEGGTMQEGSLGTRLRADLDAMRWETIRQLSEELGTLKKLQLFCGAKGIVTACHYDQSPNLFLQVTGAKRFILFPPLLGASSLQPFPVTHPRDRCARLDLDREDRRGECSAAFGQGIEAIVEAGDVLFLPQMWWHHVESLDLENISLSLWLQGGSLDRTTLALDDPTLVTALSQPLALELFREWEFLLATTIGYGPELELFLWWLRDPSCRGDAAATSPASWLRCGTFLLQHAFRLLPLQWLRHFLGYFDPQRFQQLRNKSAENTTPQPDTPSCSLPLRPPRGRPFRLLSAVVLFGRWRSKELGREAWELEGWPCGRATKKRSGHPRVTSDQLRQVLLHAGLGHRLTLGSWTTPASRDEPEPAKLKGVMKAALGRCNALLANDALRTLSHLLRQKRLPAPSQGRFEAWSHQLVEQALHWQCPSEEQLEEQLIQERSGSSSVEPVEALMSRLVKQLLPEWLEAPWAQKAADWRLSLALECWDRCATQWDVEGVGLYAAIALELGDRGGAGRALEQLGRAVDWRLAFQPAFLEDLASNGLTPCKAPSLDAGYAYLPELVQRAAALAAQGTLQGVLRRRHGAVLLDGPRVVTEGERAWTGKRSQTFFPTRML
ncbi:unnamed protein product [Durusdinium trenchii]|uniref:JmjC domain-containing protein n=1 Tax=Durusdinium trenchii TaxID=1381693 RepID=A0ABP0S5Z2_9DINO